MATEAPLTTKEKKADEENRLVDLAIAGDQAAFAELYKIYFRPIASKMAFKYGHGDKSIGEDIAQDALINASRYIKGFKKEASFSSWIHRIAFNTAHKRHARIKHTLEFNAAISSGKDQNGEEILEDDYISSNADTTNDMVTLPSDPLHILEKLEALDMAQTTIENLKSASDQAVVKGIDLLLRMIDGDLQYADLARQDEIPIGTVRSRISRARAALEKEFQKLSGKRENPKTRDASVQNAKKAFEKLDPNNLSKEDLFLFSSVHLCEPWETTALSDIAEALNISEKTAKVRLAKISGQISESIDDIPLTHKQREGFKNHMNKNLAHHQCRTIEQFIFDESKVDFSTSKKQTVYETAWTVLKDQPKELYVLLCARLYRPEFRKDIPIIAAELCRRPDTISQILEQAIEKVRGTLPENLRDILPTEEKKPRIRAGLSKDFDIAQLAIDPATLDLSTPERLHIYETAKETLTAYRLYLFCNAYLIPKDQMLTSHELAGKMGIKVSALRSTMTLTKKVVFSQLSDDLVKSGIFETQFRQQKDSDSDIITGRTAEEIETPLVTPEETKQQTSEPGIVSETNQSKKLHEGLQAQVSFNQSSAKQNNLQFATSTHKAKFGVEKFCQVINNQQRQDIYAILTLDGKTVTLPEHDGKTDIFFVKKQRLFAAVDGERFRVRQIVHKNGMRVSLENDSIVIERPLAEPTVFNVA